MLVHVRVNFKSHIKFVSKFESVFEFDPFQFLFEFGLELGFECLFTFELSV